MVVAQTAAGERAVGGNTRRQHHRQQSAQHGRGNFRQTAAQFGQRRHACRQQQAQAHRTGCRGDVAPLPGDGLWLLVAGRQGQQRRRGSPQPQAQQGQAAQGLAADLFPGNSKQQRRYSQQPQHKWPEHVALADGAAILPLQPGTQKRDGRGHLLHGHTGHVGDVQRKLIAGAAVAGTGKVEAKRHRHAAQHRGRGPQAAPHTAGVHHPQQQHQHGVDIAGLVSAAGDKRQYGRRHAPGAMVGLVQVKQAQPAGRRPKQRALGHGVVTVHALVKNRSRRQRQTKGAQSQGIAAAELCRHAADQESRRARHGNDVQPVAGQRAVKQQRHRVGVVEREEPHLL